MKHLLNETIQLQDKTLVIEIVEMSIENGHECKGISGFLNGKNVFEFYGIELNECSTMAYIEGCYKGDLIAELCSLHNIPFSEFNNVLLQNNIINFYYEGYEW